MQELIVCGHAPDTIISDRLPSCPSHLWPPELDVSLLDVQSEQILADLVIDEGLGDVPPGRGWTTDQQVHKQQHHHRYTTETILHYHFI